MSSTSSRSPASSPGGGSLALRLTAWYVGSSFTILLIASISLYWILIGNVRREQDQFLDDKVRVVRDLLSRRPNDLPDLQEEVEQTWAPRQFARVYVRVVDGSGKVIAESPHMSDRLSVNAFPRPVGASAGPGDGISLTGNFGKAMRVLAARAVIGSDPPQTAVIQVGLNTETAHDLVTGYRQTLLLVLGLGLAFCGFAGYWLARIGLKPLRQITATTQRIRSTNLAERIVVEGLPSELSTLGLRFNDMLERLEESFGRLSRFSADIAHELRTPVNNLRIEVEVGLGRARSLEEYRETLGSCLEECGRLSRIIDSMLFIARSEDPRTQVAKEPLDVSVELERVREFFELPANDAGVELSVTCGPRVHACLDRMLFQRAVTNLVGNALRYTPRGGSISVSATRENGELHVQVKDTGIGIRPQDLPHIFDRFYRADPARSTSGGGNVGLGLAIVKSIVTLHNGSIAAQSVVNEGACMSIRLPAEDPDAKPRGKAGHG